MSFRYYDHLAKRDARERRAHRIKEASTMDYKARLRAIKQYAARAEGYQLTSYELNDIVRVCDHPAASAEEKLIIELCRQLISTL